MTFIISNYKILDSVKINDIYVKGNYLKSGNNFLIIEGVFYLKNKINESQLLTDIINKGINVISSLKGYFCGIFYNSDANLLYFFTDKIGYYDLFYSLNQNDLIISNSFNEILKNREFSSKIIDEQSIIEFLIFQYPLFEKTFIKFIKFVPLGTIFEYNLNTYNLEKINYWDYKFNINSSLNIKESISKLDDLFNMAMINIKNIYPPNSVYGLGLSGGMDSRLICYYAIKHKMRIKTFIFGEKNSDAFYISKKLSNLFKLDHYELGYKKDFFKYSHKSINFNPMMDVLFTWYYAISKKLPNFDVLLTGFNGDNQFGSHLNKKDQKIRNDKDFVNIIFDKYYELKNFRNLFQYINDKSNIIKIKDNITEFSKNSLNVEYWQKKEEFNYKYRQRIYIKNNPSFNFLGLYKSISIFIDPDLLEFLMTIPFKFRLNRYLFFEFLKKKATALVKIRAERQLPVIYNKFLVNIIMKVIVFIKKYFKINILIKKSHKRIWTWLSNYDLFSNYLNNEFLKNNKAFYEIFNHRSILDLLSKRKWNEYEIYLIFRLLTIKIFLDKING